MRLVAGLTSPAENSIWWQRASRAADANARSPFLSAFSGTHRTDMGPIDEKGIRSHRRRGRISATGGRCVLEGVRRTTAAMVLISLVCTLPTVPLSIIRADDDSSMHGRSMVIVMLDVCSKALDIKDHSAAAICQGTSSGVGPAVPIGTLSAPQERPLSQTSPEPPLQPPSLF